MNTMTFVRVAFAVIAPGAFATPRAHAQDTASAEQFLRQVYLDEEKGIPGPEPKAIYDPELLSLILRDREYGQKYEKALIRVDPICDCQDADGLRVQRVTMQPKGSGGANAAVSFTISGHRSVVNYQLVGVDGQWRIHDILGHDPPSLRQYLITGLTHEEREIRRGRR